jgi:hypothetical protein
MLLMLVEAAAWSDFELVESAASSSALVTSSALLRAL